MYRLYDWDCDGCGMTHAELYWTTGGKVPPREAEMLCPGCEGYHPHRRVVSMPAVYLADRPLNPMVQGGSFDTMGYRPTPMVPDHPLGDAATWTDWKDHWRSKEWQNARAEQKNVIKQNKQKRKRAAAIKRGENINMRVDRCEGDPRIAD